MIEIKNVSFTEIYNNWNFKNLIDEISIDPDVIIQDTPILVKVEAYKNMEASGTLQIYGAYSSDKVIGFISIMTPNLPHNVGKLVIVDAVFVSPLYKPTGAGLKLISEAEDFANSKEAGIIFSAGAESTLEKVLLGRDYKVIRHILHRAYKNE